MQQQKRMLDKLDVQTEKYEHTKGSAHAKFPLSSWIRLLDGSRGKPTSFTLYLSQCLVS